MKAKARRSSRPRKVREYRTDYAITADDRRRMLAIAVPESLFNAIRAKADREGISVRSLVLDFLSTWSDKR